MNHTNDEKVMPQADTPASEFSTTPPELMTENELITFLRIREVSKARDYHNVVTNLQRFHDLPSIHMCGKCLYPKEAILKWIRTKTGKGKQ